MSLRLLRGCSFGAVAGGEGALELAGVLQMFAVGDGEAVSSVELLAGAEIDVFVGLGIQHGLQTCLRRHIDRRWWKAYMLVGVVW